MTAAANALGDQPARRKWKRRAAAEVERAERINEALGYRKQGYTYRQIGDAMEIAPSTAHGMVMAGIATIPTEDRRAVKTIMLDQCDEIMQRLMPLLDDGAPKDVIDGILKVQSRQMQLHGLGRVSIGLGDDDGEDGDDESIIIARIIASAPVLRPDGPVPANPVL